MAILRVKDSDGNIIEITAIKGDKPIKGVDYFTQSDIDEFLRLFNQLVPTKTSELTNDSGYLTRTDIDDVLKTFVATYTTKELIAGITVEVGVKFIYEEEVDSFSIVVEDTVVVDKAPVNQKARVAAELLKAEKTRFVFYDGDTIVYIAKILNTLPGRGMLFIEN